MTDKLPPNLLALFAPRPSLRYLPPADHAPEERKTAQFSGVAAFLQQAEEHKRQLPPPSAESWFEKQLQKTVEKAELVKKLSNPKELGYDPKNDPQIRGDAFKTLFLARLSYDTTQQDLERVFARFGPIERIRIVTDTHAKKEGKSAKKNRGYAFIVFEKESDMRTAYRETENIYIRDRRILVDVERGRTVADWAPRRFGGGLGGRGYTRGAAARPLAAGGQYGGPRGFSDRGGRGGGPPRGGFRGGDRGPSGGGRDMNGRGVGYQSSGFGARGAAPPNAPSGPGGGRSGDYDDRRPRNGGYSSGGRDYGRGVSGSNMEPVRPRDGPGGGYSDRDRPRDGGRERYGDRDRERDRGDRDRGYGRREDDYAGSKRAHEDGARYDDRSKRRY